ncbi:biliverdin-producing heme oxygenase [Achromobacter xylosoxidans]|uniref:biliverdin-producing heme oxygenase n=1 Tax=Alcaligenes xylosoxydans xylosoxydans TaxID=85698 RepID=UPI000B48C683|nr:biliverdin-producing heme oxygenase [Achromobacter xylosoxidans]
MTQAPSTLAERAKRLKAHTTSTHDTLDRRIMDAGIFDSRERYAGFLRVQYRFMRDVDALYARADLAALLPDLSERRRLDLVAQDLADLGDALPRASSAIDADISLPHALGWLYVSEGSTLGAAVLYKQAGARLGLDRDFGARHLNGHAEGVARHWRGFAAALDAVPLTAEEEQLVVTGAQAAFGTVRGYVEQELA